MELMAYFLSLDIVPSGGEFVNYPEDKVICKDGEMKDRTWPNIFELLSFLLYEKITFSYC